MKTQVALRINDTILELARRAADRESRSLANYIEVVLAESLMIAEGSHPIVTLFDDASDLNELVAINEDGTANADETANLRGLISLAETR